MKTRPTIKFVLALTVLMLLVQGCSGGSLFATATPTPTHTSTPTTTPTVTPSITPSPTITSTPTLTPTPLPPLDILGCAPELACPEESEPIFYFFPDQRLRYGREYELTITSDKMIRYFTGWCTTTEEILESNLKEIEFIFKIDESQYVDLLKSDYHTVPNESNPSSDPGFCYSVSGVVSGWESGHTYRIEFGFSILSEIDDGWDTYPPADLTRTYIITVE